MLDSAIHQISIKETVNQLHFNLQWSVVYNFIHFLDNWGLMLSLGGMHYKWQSFVNMWHEFALGYVMPFNRMPLLRFWKQYL